MAQDYLRVGRLCSLVASALMVLGCSGDTQAYRGTAFPFAKERPDLVLEDASGEPYDFLRKTEGKVALVFVGFTHCPDICPIHMATLSSVVTSLPPELSQDLEVVFVTADPERDTQERLKEWMAAFHPSFVALRGTVDQVHELERTVGFPESILGEPRQAEVGQVDAGQVEAGQVDAQSVEGGGEYPGEYDVMHSARMALFDRKGESYLSYLHTTTKEDWTHDLTLILRDGFQLSIANP